MKMTVRAKMRCNSVTKTGSPTHPSINVQLGAIYSNDPDSENRSFARATPSGSLTLNIDPSMPASGAFELGADYYVDMIPCGVPEWYYLRDGNLPPNGGEVIVSKKGGGSPLVATLVVVPGSGVQKIVTTLEDGIVVDENIWNSNKLYDLGYRYWKMPASD